METQQLVDSRAARASRRAAARYTAVRLATSLWLAAGALASACASAPAPRPAPVVLAERCVRGPFCVTGEVDDQFSIAVEGARCTSLGVDGVSATVLSDARGVFFIDGLPSLPSEVRFAKAGFASQTVAVLPSAAGSAARVYVIFHRMADSECSCEPSAIMAGHEPCPDDKCGRTRFDVTIPESRGPAPAPRP